VTPKLSRLEFDHTDGAALHVRGDSEAGAPGDVAVFALSTAPRRVTALAEFRFALEPGDKPPALIDIAADDASPSRVLGDISPVAGIPTADGASGPVVLEFPAVQIHEAGIRRYDVMWNWRWRPSGSVNWLPFDGPSRVVYVTLGPPSAPWSQATDLESQQRWPWTRLLEHACKWAAGVTLAAGFDAAAKRVSRLIEAAVYDLGRQNLLTYGIGGALVVGQDSVFKASALLRVLDRVRRELPMTVYCTECAAAVAAVANCLGANLSLLRVQRTDYSRMDLNRVWAIGAPGPTSPPFIYHELTVHQHQSSKRKHVFDGCLQADWNTNARSDEAKFGLARGRPLGARRLIRDGATYLQRLLAPEELLSERLDVAGSAMPQLEFRTTTVRPDVADDRVKVRQRTRIDEECKTPRAADDDSSATCDTPSNISEFHIPGFHVYKQFDISHLTELGPLVTAYAGFAYTVNRSGLVGENFDPDRRFRISVGWSANANDAREALAWLMTRTDRLLPPFKRRRSKLGDAAFATPDQEVVFLVRGNVFARLVNTGRILIPMGPIAERVDRAILQMTRPSRRRAPRR
jgi:hypothetical protein